VWVVRASATYARDRFGHASEEVDVEGVDLGRAELLGVLVEPEVVSAIAAEILLVAAQVQVPHPFLFLC
jgi:hypothetical protein